MSFSGWYDSDSGGKSAEKWPRHSQDAVKMHNFHPDSDPQTSLPVASVVGLTSDSLRNLTCFTETLNLHYCTCSADPKGLLSLRPEGWLLSPRLGLLTQWKSIFIYSCCFSSRHRDSREIISFNASLCSERIYFTVWQQNTLRNVSQAKQKELQ